MDAEKPKDTFLHRPTGRVTRCKASLLCDAMVPNAKPTPEEGMELLRTAWRKRLDANIRSYWQWAGHLKFWADMGCPDSWSPPFEFSMLSERPEVAP